MNTKALSSVAILGMVAALFVGCGDGDSTKIKICSPRKVKCLNDRTGEVCGSDGTVKQPFTCSEGEVCGTNEDGKTGCVGGCEAGETECASEAISRVCSDDGKTWIPVACEPGTGCDNREEIMNMPNAEFGTCVRIEDPVTVCTPDQTTCADGQTVKACEQDGSNWVYTACAGNEACEEGECIVDPDKKCTPNTGTCVDATHVKKCADSGEEYDPPEACPGQTTCSDGACRGPVCTVDEVRCDDVRDGNVFAALTQGTYQPRALYTCIDGESWQLTECAPNEVCAYTDISSTSVNQYIEDLKTAYERGSTSNLPLFNIPESSRASCQTPECAAPFAFRELLSSSFYEGLFGSFACGDPTAQDPTFNDSFSLCEGLPPYNNLHWANYTCPEGSECSYETQTVTTGSSSQAPICSSTCAENDVRCFDPRGESTITCHDGEWDLGSVSRCVDGSREQWCRRNLISNVTNYTQATCQDPACVIWQDQFETFIIPPGYGACGDDGMFYQCLPDGTMDRGVDCPSCVRSTARAPTVQQPSQTPSFFAGYQPGYCVDECSDGEQMCINIQSSQPSPFYYECDNGHWTTVASCPDGEACRDFPRSGDPLPPREIICGGVCFPDQMRCVNDQGVPTGELRQICGRNGEWGDAEPCDRGICTQDDQQFPGSAACEDECIPGTMGCQNGQQVTCDSDARFGDPEPCETGEACIATPSLARLGCIECVPRDPTNQSSVADSRCDGSDLQVCSPNGTWATGSATTCPGGCATLGGQSPGGQRAQCNPFTGGGGQGGGGQGGGGAAGRAGGGAGGAGGAGRAGGGSGGALPTGGSGGTLPTGGFAGLG